MGTRRAAGRVLFAVVLGIVVIVALVVLVTWGVDAGGSGAGQDRPPGYSFPE